MDRRFAWLGGAAGGLAAGRWRRRQAKPGAQGEGDPLQAPRAELEGSRAVVDEGERFEERETPVDQAPDLDDRRRSVHEEARARMDELRGDDVPEPPATPTV